MTENVVTGATAPVETGAPAPVGPAPTGAGEGRTDDEEEGCPECERLDAALKETTLKLEAVRLSWVLAGFAQDDHRQAPHRKVAP